MTTVNATNNTDANRVEFPEWAADRNGHLAWRYLGRVGERQGINILNVRWIDLQYGQVVGLADAQTIRGHLSTV